jgi:hypothetical protein
MMAGPGCQMRDVSCGLSHPAWPACTLTAGASDRTSPGPTRSVYDPFHRPETALLSRLLAGVCGSFASYFNLDATLIRVLFVVLAVL